MVGFGFMDNTVMIHAGNAIDLTLGVTLGLSTLAAAAIGQICSDVAGVTFGGFIDAACRRLGMPSPGFTDEQRNSPLVKRVGLFGSVVGVFCGCSLGLLNLLFIDTSAARELKIEAQDPDLEFSVSISNSVREDATAITIDGPSTKGLIGSVTYVFTQFDLTLQEIHSEFAATGLPKCRKLIVTKGDKQVDDEDLEALAHTLMQACRQPGQARALVQENAQLRAENEELTARLKRMQNRLEGHLTTITTKKTGEPRRLVQLDNADVDQ